MNKKNIVSFLSIIALIFIASGATESIVLNILAKVGV